MWLETLGMALSAGLAGALLALGFWMGKQSSESTLVAARAVSSMTTVLADEANRQASLASSIVSIETRVQQQTESATLMAAAFDRLDSNMALILDAMVSRGMMRRASRPAQAGETEAPPPKLPLEMISESPAPPTVTG